MSMEITNNYSDYGKGYTNTAKEGNVTTRTVELKTSTGGTKTEQIKTGYSNVNDYSKYLQGKYSYMNSGTTSMQGVPTTVSVSGAFLKKCMNDPEKAKYLEENLAALPDCFPEEMYERSGKSKVSGRKSGGDSGLCEKRSSRLSRNSDKSQLQC